MKYPKIILSLFFAAATLSLLTYSCNKKQEPANATLFDIKGKTIVWHWTKGDYAGGIYKNTFNQNGTVAWQSLAGGEKGDSGIEKNYNIFNISDNIVWVSWYETSNEKVKGTTVSVILNIKNKKAYGIISNGDGAVSLSGIIESIN
jgi:hypothetical protein